MLKILCGYVAAKLIIKNKNNFAGLHLRGINIKIMNRERKIIDGRIWKRGIFVYESHVMQGKTHVQGLTVFLVNR